MITFSIQGVIINHLEWDRLVMPTLGKNTFGIKSPAPLANDSKEEVIFLPDLTRQNVYVIKICIPRIFK